MQLSDIVTNAGLGAVAVIEAMAVIPEATMKDWHLPEFVTGFDMHVLPIALLSLLFLFWLVKVALGWGRTRRALDILSPVEGETVGLRRKVQGSVRPAGSNVQVLVYSGDDRWHPQQSPVADGRLWSVECQFGLPEAGRNEGYQVIAIVGAPKLTKPVTRIPWRCLRSQAIRVSRGG